jgi:hypothetical protein
VERLRGREPRRQAPGLFIAQDAARRAPQGGSAEDKGPHRLLGHSAGSTSRAPERRENRAAFAEIGLRPAGGLRAAEGARQPKGHLPHV